MCSFKNFHHSRNGYVVQCRKCAYFQLAFGSVAITLTQEQLHEFYETINDYYEVYKDGDCPDQKTIRIPTALPAFMLALSINDLKMIREMLDETCIVMEMTKIFAHREN